MIPSQIFHVPIADPFGRLGIPQNSTALMVSIALYNFYSIGLLPEHDRFGPDFDGSVFASSGDGGSVRTPPSGQAGSTVRLRGLVQSPVLGVDQLKFALGGGDEKHLVALWTYTTKIR